MKRTIIIFISCFFLFTSCELLEYLFMEPGASTYEEASKTVEVTSTGKVYLVKLNKSNNKIGKDYTGKVTSVNSRTADDVFEQKYNDTDSFIRAVNERLNNIVLDNSRAADTSSPIKTEINELGFSKGGTKSFWSYTDIQNPNDYNSGIPGQVSTTCKYVGKHCYVFADNNNDKKAILNLSDSDYKALGQKFDDCYELEIKVIGNPLYQKYHSTYFNPCNDKIIILVSDLFGDAKSGQTLGYFSPSDLFKQTYLDETLNKGKSKTSISYYHSNGYEMFYLDTYFLKTRPDVMYSTLVHEFNHMINYVIKTVGDLTTHPNATSLNSCSKWFTEMLSMVTEDMFQSYLEIDDEDSPKGRLPYFNNFYYYGFKNWDDKTSGDKYFDYYMYANTYAFGAYLARNFGGVELIKEIAQNSYVDEEAITAGLKKVNSGKKDLDFLDVLQKFSHCLFDVQIQDDDEVYTFNKSAGKKSDILYFSAIDINKIKVDDGSGNKRTYPPKIYNQNESPSVLWPYGFSVHYIGKNIDSFKFVGNNNGDLQYFLLQE